MDYSKLAEIYEKLEQTTKRLEKTYILHNLLKDTKDEDLKILVYLLQGRVFPEWDERKLGMSSRLILKVLNTSTGASLNEIEKLWTKKGDLGLVAEILTKERKQKTLFSQKLTVKKVYDNLQLISTLEGKGTVSRKVQLVSELVTSATPREAKYIVRTVLEVLRVGVAAGILRDSIAWAFLPKVIGIFFKCNNCNEFSPKSDKCLYCSKPLKTKFKDEIQKRFRNCLKVKSLEELTRNKIIRFSCILAEDEKLARQIYNNFINEVQNAYNLSNDFSEVALAIKKHKELKIKLQLSKPINPMLAVRAENITKALEAVNTPALVEFKIDGFRLQIHKEKDKFWFFTRNLENVTKQFEELIPILKKNVKASSYILDTEIVGIDPKTDKYLPFQSISQRIKRKYDIRKVSREIPVEINVFDILYKNNKPLLSKTQEERRKILEKTIKEVNKKIVLTKKLVSDDENKISEFYKLALKKGLEGVIIKNLNRVYVPGRRVSGWVKLKPILENLDLVIVGATYGEGKRASILSSFRLACYDTRKNKFLGCGMMSSGLKEKKSEGGVTYEEINKLLEPLIIKKENREVKIKPKIVIEVTYEEIQKSPNYDSGFALRFPRFSRLRYMERKAKDVNTINDIERLYEKQRGRSKR